MTDAANGVRPQAEPTQKIPVSTPSAGQNAKPAYAEPSPRQTAKSAPAGTGSRQAPKPTSKTIEKNRKIILTSIIVTCAVLLICMSVGIWYFFSSTADDGRIYNNVYLAGINMGGKTPEEAAEALHAAADTSYPITNMVVHTNKGMLILTPDKTGARLDVDKIVEEAYQYGRGGSRSENAKIRAEAALTTHTIELLPYLNLNTDYIRGEVHSFVEKHSGTLTQPQIQESGSRPVLLPIPEDPTAVAQTLTITAGTPGLAMDEEVLFNTVLDAYNANDFSGIHMDFVMTEPDKLDAAALFRTYCILPMDAQLDPKTFDITSEVWGYGILMEDLTKLMQELDRKGSVEIPLGYLAPTVTRQQLEATLFQDVLGTYDSSYNQYNYPRATNLELSAAAINGKILMPGEVFSFNETVGERTREKGYQSAGAYVSGGSVDQVGGGICQVASTIYYSCLMADLEIVDREEHMYVVSYVPMGMDATINWGTIDYQFKNNTNYPIRMETWAKDGEVHVALYGTDEKDYYVKMEYEILETYEWETVEKEFPPDNEEEYEDGEVVTDPHTGYDVKTYRCKYDKNTDKLISREYEATSNFEKQDKIICIIKDPNATTEPETTEPETTQPETTEPEHTEPETSTPDETEPEQPDESQEPGETEPDPSTDPAPDDPDSGAQDSDGDD